MKKIINANKHKNVWLLKVLAEHLFKYFILYAWWKYFTKSWYKKVEHTADDG